MVVPWFLVVVLSLVVFSCSLEVPGGGVLDPYVPCKGPLVPGGGLWSLLQTPSDPLRSLVLVC